MLSVFDGLRSVTTLSVFVRLACAFICGGIIGIERSYKRRPAGFRTHILICIGAAITTLTSQYLYLNMHYFTDMARLGAQVVAGIGFIGAGTIIIHRQLVRGLTTAASLWATAGIGLAAGAHMYVVAAAATVLTLFALEVLTLVFGGLGRRRTMVVFSATKRAAVDEMFNELQSREYAVISYGLDNASHHPAGETLQRLFDVGATVYGTGKSGSIVLTTDGWTYSFNTSQALTAADAGV